MGCDMAVALGTATGNGPTLFGANSHRASTEPQGLRFVPGRTFTSGEALPTPFFQVPQVRQTLSVLAVRPNGSWGYVHGVNEHRVAVGCSDWQSRLQREGPGLLGLDLVRLTLERSHSAQQALDVLTDLIVRHGQGSFPGSPEGETGDHVFLIADTVEAFAVEAAGPAWAAQEICQVRAASDVGVIHQDWYRLAPGLGGRAIAEGWWADDGSKLDFVGALSQLPTGKASALRRWGRATLLLEQQNGHIDTAFVRQLLADHYEDTRFEVDPLAGPSKVKPLCQHATADENATAISSVAQLPADPAALPVFWVAFGPPCIGVYFPLLLDGDLPQAFSGEPAALFARSRQLARHLGTDGRRWLRLREEFGRLQARFDKDLQEFLGDAASLHRRGEVRELRRLAGGLMQNHVERFEENVQVLLAAERLEGREPAMAGVRRRLNGA
jgi:dipeptidase